jgi:lipoate-protein ligase A
MSSPLPVCRLIIDEPAPGSWNMAVDEALLAEAIESSIATLRIYRWIEPTLSLGYFQRYDDRSTHATSRDCATVRRQSGGGAILHDRELTYSLALPATHPVTRDATALYNAVHNGVIRALTPYLRQSEVDIKLRLNCVESPRAPRDEPFLCFERRSRGDLLLEAASGVGKTDDGSLAYKILGSAQRRHRGAILQHGSLLLERSAAAPELPGWQELTGVAIGFEQFAAALPQQLLGVVANHWVADNLSASTRDAAQRIERAKYSDSSWTCRR